MDDRQVGTALRSIRVRQRKTQDEVARLAHVSRYVVGRIEHGHLDGVPLGKIRAVASALDARVDFVLRWHGGDLGRLINARHSAMHDSIAKSFESGWQIEPEVSFSIYGEGGVIDVLAWHPARRCLLVIELKTELVDINELMGTLDRKRRPSADIGMQHGWEPISVSTWVAVADSRTNRRAVETHVATLRAKFPDAGRTVRGWLRDPKGRIDALSFLPYAQGAHLRQLLSPVRRVRRRSKASDRARQPSVERPEGLT